MTPEEAIKTIRVAFIEVEWHHPIDYAIAFGTAIKALEKQIKKKPIIEKDKVMFRKKIRGNCPVCGSAVYSTANLFCNHCGQALDWGDTE